MSEDRKCSYCGKKAFLETPVYCIDLCNRDECKIAFVDDQCSDIEEEM